MSKRKIDWKGEIASLVLKTLRENPKWRFPTIRSVFYFLGDTLKVIPLTEQGYKQLDKLLVDMRKDRQIPFGRFSVVRGVSGNYGAYALPPKQLVDFRVNNLLNMPDEYELPLNYGQPTLIEVWEEKKGLLPTFEELTSDLDIKIRSPEGFTPWEFCNGAIKDMNNYFDERLHERVEIIYFGDLDPSGVQIYDSLGEQLEFFGVDFELERIGVHVEQVREYGLPDSPKEKETLAKIHRDSRLRKFVAKHGEIFCELDSFISLAPDEFKGVLRENILNKLDDEKLKWRNKKNKEIKKKVGKAIKPYREEIEEVRIKINAELPDLPKLIDKEEE